MKKRLLNINHKFTPFREENLFSHLFDATSRLGVFYLYYNET